MLALNLNYLPIEVKVRRRNGLLSSVVPANRDSFTDEELEILSIKLERMGIDHFINSHNEISISNDIDIAATDVLTSFKDSHKIDITKLRDIHALQNAIYEAFLALRDKGICGTAGELYILKNIKLKHKGLEQIDVWSSILRIGTNRGIYFIISTNVWECESC